jgi:Flp pilus assembly protein TadB
VTGALIAPLAFSALCGLSGGVAYLLWPRRLTAMEWVAHRRAAEGRPLPQAERQSPSWSAGMVSRLAKPWRLPTDIARDLALLRLTDTGLPTSEPDLRRNVMLAVPVAGAAGLMVGFAVWLVQGFVGFPSLALLLPIAGGLGAPALLLRTLRRRAGSVRAAVDRNLPRVLTGARMLLESGAATPERALTTAAALYEDAATEMLREAGRIREIQLVTIDVALDRVADLYGVGGLHRLADAYRIGRQYGTGMGSVLADFAENLRKQAESDEEARISSAPVEMIFPGLAFFFTPFFLLMLYLVYTPFAQVLNR